MKKKLKSHFFKDETDIKAPKIAYIVSMMSGLESFIKREMEELVDRGYFLRLFATKYKSSPGFNPREDIPFDAPSMKAVVQGFIRWSLSRPALVLSLFREAIRLRGTVELLLALSWAIKLRKENIELIHCSFGDRKYFVGYFMHRLSGLPLTVAIHAHEIYAQPNEALFRHALHYTCGIVTISAKNAHLLNQKYDIEAHKIEQIRLSIDLNFWKHRNDTINVLTVARFTPRKGWHELIDAIQHLDSRFHFYAVGFGDLDIDGLAKAAGVSDRFIVFPKLQPKQLRLLMQACDIFCLPSKHTLEEGSEGIPVVLMEAMAMGMPIVTTDDGSISELAEHEIVPTADAQALAHALLKTAQHSCKPRQLSQNSNRARVTAMHSAKNLDKLDAFFRSRIHNK